MAERTGNLTYKQAKALAALVSQPTIGMAAAVAQVGERTLCRWLNEDEAFRAEFRRLQREVVSNATYQLMKASNNAVNALTSVMNDPEAPATSRVQAAKVVLEMAYKGIDQQDMAEQIARLTAEVEHLKGLAQALPSPVEQPNGHKRRSRVW